MAETGDPIGRLSVEITADKAKLDAVLAQAKRDLEVQSAELQRVQDNYNRTAAYARSLGDQGAGSAVDIAQAFQRATRIIGQTAAVIGGVTAAIYAAVEASEFLGKKVRKIQDEALNKKFGEGFIPKEELDRLEKLAAEERKLFVQRREALEYLNEQSEENAAELLSLAEERYKLENGEGALRGKQLNDARGRFEELRKLAVENEDDVAAERFRIAVENINKIIDLEDRAKKDALDKQYADQRAARERAAAELAAEEEIANQRRIEAVRRENEERIRGIREAQALQAQGFAGAALSGSTREVVRALREIERNTRPRLESRG